jgi:hypothetical protein
MKIGKNHFSGASNMYGTGNRSLNTVIRGIAIDLARTRVEAMTGSSLQFTDNSTGTGFAIANLVLPVNPVDAVGGNAAQLAALNTALGKTENGMRVIGTVVNLVRGRIGLNQFTFGAGTVATAGTVPAQDKTVAAATGTSAAQHASGRAALVVARENMRKLVYYINEVLIALGSDPLINPLTGQVPNLALADIPTVVASAATGLVALDRAITNAFLTALADNMKAITTQWNSALAEIDAGQNLSVVAG